MTTSTEPIATALASYYDRTGFDKPSEKRRWAKIKIGPFPFFFPNSRARVRALRLHDLHHLATGYGTDLRGEAEQSAWELAAGCHHHWFAWAINLAGVAMGLALAPIRTYRAFVRGRNCSTLYDGEFHPSLLVGTVGSLRSRLKLAN